MNLAKAKTLIPRSIYKPFNHRTKNKAKNINENTQIHTEKYEENNTIS